MNRRNFLVMGGASLVSLVVLLLGLDHFRRSAGGQSTNSQATLPAANGSNSSGEVTSAGSVTPTNAPLPYGPEFTSGPAASPSPDVLAKRIEAAPGTRPEITPADKFYRIDINLIPPEIDGKNWRLVIKGLVQKPLSLSLEQIRAYPAVTQAVTLSCISNPVGGDLIGSNYWTGVRFKDILAEAGLLPTAREIAMQAADGFYEGISVEEALDERTLLVYAMNGAPLTSAHGFPLRIYIPDHYGMKQPKWITQMDVIDKPAAGYWVDRGWSAKATPKTTSVIDTIPVFNQDLKDGIFPLGGIAWAGARGIRKVEVQIDQGAWIEAQLRTPAISPLTWVQWRYDWKTVPGTHTVQVRATDGSGVLQETAETPTIPDGATGLHSVRIKF